MRGERCEILHLIIEEIIVGKRSVGQMQNSWLKDLRRWLGRTSTEIFRAAISRTMMTDWTPTSGDGVLRRRIALVSK